jgi:methylated-DNA-[protein]-cysteine S-methyltransferase
MDNGYALFDTAIGRCGIAWTERGVSAVQLPERDGGTLRRRLHERTPQATASVPPAAVRHAIDAITALLRGEPLTLDDIELDWHGVAPFDRRVYELARRIAPGTTLTYGDLATRLGEPGAARAVGRALGRNPFAPVVPCHRVVAAAGGIGGFSAHGGTATKRRMLLIEGAPISAPLF